MTTAHFDGLVSILGIIGLWPVLRRLFKSDSPNLAECRLRWLFVTLSFAFLFRVPYVAFGLKGLGLVVYALFVVAAFQVFLFFETLLRRHMPLALKLWMSVGCLVFILLALTGHLAGDLDVLRGFLVFMTIGQLWTVLVCVLRDRKEYSAAENHFIHLCLGILVVLNPFFFTDVSVYDLGDMPRLGVLGALLFAYFAINAEALFQEGTKIVRQVIKAVVFSLLLTVMLLSLLPPQPGPVQTRILVLFLCVNFIFRIYYALKHVDGEDTASRYIKELRESDKKSQSRFLDDMSRLFERVRKEVVGREQLGARDPALMCEVFELRQTTVFSLYELRQISEEPAMQAGSSSRELEAIEQMIHLMEERAMNHICMVDPDQRVFLLFDFVAIGYSQQIHLQAGLVVEIARLIKAASDIRAEPTSRLP